MHRYVRVALYAAAALVAAVLAVYAFVVVSTHSSVYTSVADVPHAQVALLLGASVMQNGTLSDVLRARADAAAALYKAHKVDKILVTGDNSQLSHNEVNPTGKYLLSLGIPKADIFLDHAGFDTYSSMYRARDVFGVYSLVVVSQAFHLPRALLDARGLGLTASALEAPGQGLYLYNWAREVPATFKTLWDLEFNRVPKYLGNKIDITGDGSSTWADQGGATSVVPVDILWQ